MSNIDGKILKNARLALGISQAEVARKLCISVNHIEELESNQLKLFFSHRHKTLTAVKLGALLGLKAEDLFSHPPISTMSGENLGKAPHLSLLQNHKVNEGQKERISISTEDLKPASYRSGLKNHKKLTLLLTGLLTSAIVIFLFTQNEPQKFKPNNRGEQSVYDEPQEPKLDPLSTSAIQNPKSPDELPAATKNNNPCILANLNPEEFTPVDPIKPSNFVYVLARHSLDFCIKDALNKSSIISLDTDQSRVITGKAPFTIIGNNLQDLEIYFQGKKAQKLQEHINAIALNPVPLSQ